MPAIGPLQESVILDQDIVTVSAHERLPARHHLLLPMNLTAPYSL